MKSDRQAFRRRGFSLLELMIVVVLIELGTAVGADLRAHGGLQREAVAGRTALRLEERRADVKLVDNALTG